MFGKACIFAAIGLIHVAAPARLCAQGGGKAELRPVRIATPPKLDGILDDEAWSGEPLPLDGWMSYNPMRGEPAAEKTQVVDRLRRRSVVLRVPMPRQPTRKNSDEHQPARQRLLGRLGRCQPRFEPRRAARLSPVRQPQRHSDGRAPERIDGRRLRARLGVAKRGTCRRRWVVGRNPRAAREHPLSQWCRRAHGRVVLAAPQPHGRFNLVAGAWRTASGCSNRTRTVAFDELQSRRLFETIPSATFSGNQARSDASRWNDTRARGDFGVSVKYGLTSAITLDATVNPDFSQVESDAFEVEVNQRFPIFFSEKRPFFMEGLGLFNLAGTGGDSTMRTAVHTRKIIEPSAGLKLTGARAGTRSGCCHPPTRLRQASGSAGLRSSAK